MKRNRIPNIKYRYVERPLAYNLALQLACLKRLILMLSLFVSAASVELSFVGQAQLLLCGGTDRNTADWMYQESENKSIHVIAMNGTLSGDHSGRYMVDGSSFIINEVKSSDAGLYICGHGRQVYHKLQLNVNGLYSVTVISLIDWFLKQVGTKNTSFCPLMKFHKIACFMAK